ncbi:hypothetical protein ACX9R5_05425 [Rathayibacter sp. CAU 1779]
MTTTLHDLSAHPARQAAQDASPRPPASRPPRRWKLWLLTCAAIYPVITGLGYLLAATAGALPIWAHFVVMVPIAVALLVFIVMPLLTKAFFGWLAR